MQSCQETNEGTEYGQLDVVIICVGTNAVVY